MHSTCFCSLWLEQLDVVTGALKVLATAEDSRPRVMRATKEWGWRPLVSLLEREDVSWLPTL